MPENLDAWKIYTICSGQLIVGPGGPVDLDHNAIHRAMELYNIKDRKTCFEQVTKLGRYIISQQHEEWRIERESRHRTSRR